MSRKVLTFSLIILSMIFVSSITSFKTQATNLVDSTPFSYKSLIQGAKGHRLESIFFDIPADPTFLYLYIPRSSYADILKADIKTNLLGVITYQSYIQFYTEDYTSNGGYALADYDWFYGTWELEHDGTQWIELALTPFVDATNKYFRLSLIQDYALSPTQAYLDWFNQRFTFIFDSEEIDVNSGIYELTYFVSGEEWYRIGVSGIPDKPIDPVHPTLVFNGWKTKTGELYYFTSPLTTLSPSNPKTELTASWRFAWQTPHLEPPPINTSGFIDIVLTTVGMNNTVGKIMVYFVIMIFLTITLIYFKIPTFAILIVNGLLFGVCIFFGWLPFYVIIVLGLTFVLGIFKTIQGGK